MTEDSDSDLDLKNEHGDEYEVFLSFYRGKETPEFFPSRLYSSLRAAGISVFKDDISIELLQGIQGCRCFIIIFSRHYASSEVCLEELTKIMKFRIIYDHVILPIFYEVSRFEVCNQESSFGEALQVLIQRISPTEDEVSCWRRALREAGGNYGFDVPNFEYNAQSEEIIQKIIKRVRYTLDSHVYVVQCLVGMDSRVQDVIEILRSESKHVFIMGIWGMGGVGKTKLAKAIFHHIQYEFVSACFLQNVGDKWRRKVDLLSLFREKIGSLELKHKKVLLVLDDVDRLEQLNTLRGSCEQFGEGSVIIITSRDKHALKALHADLTYYVKTLNYEESLQLLSWHAFGQPYPKEEFIDLCNEVVAHVQGLPLALKAIGSSLYGRPLDEWKSVLMKLNMDLTPDIQGTLKLSFDYLDVEEKEIFLTIVEFYNGEDIDDVIQKLDARGCNTGVGMGVLQDRGFLTIDNNKLGMQRMLQHMGRQIIRETSRKELEHRAYRYEVFLNFRGEDTRATFTSHLYSALCNAGITVFKDDVELPKGKYIKMELLQAIGSSKISIIIFSREYAASKWCLDELSMIMEQHESNNNQVVLPVFYHVDPSEIRHQTSNFGLAFKDLIKGVSSYQVSEWKKALVKAGNLAGTVVLSSREESEYVNDVVGKVCDILDKKDVFVTEHPVGVDNRVQEVITMLQNHQSEDVVMIGIWGMGGVGKTTIAKAIYNEIGRTFEGRSYLSNIREVWGQEEGKVNLQNQLLVDICRTTQMKINNIASGKSILSYRLRHKKALVVLDDVDEIAQVNDLVGSRNWVAKGSAIIITTRNQDLLLNLHCPFHEIKNLDKGESNELFSWHAFKQKSPQKDFIELSEKIVAYCGGLPLALEVLGIHLSNRDNSKDWNAVLEKLKKITSNKIQKTLKVSFDGLDRFDKEIFLDICCFFIGMDRNEVTRILNGCQFFADTGIKTLVERSLVTIDEKNKLGMHDLLRDMGREIIREQSQNELGKRNRLWCDEDARAVLLKDMGTKTTEGLSLMSKSKTMQFQTKAFKKMKRLRLLRLDNIRLRGDYEYLSKNLKWLCWHRFPIEYIPSNFYQEDLVVIDLKYSSLRQVWKEFRLLESLKILNLSHSPYLVQTPDFSNLPNLEDLILKGCRSLSKIHHSIELLHKLLLLDLEDCIGLHSLPRSIYALKCLKTLILSGCNNIERLEEDIEQMESLTTLIAPTIKQLPFSLMRLNSIAFLSVCGYEGLSHHVIPSLCQSWLSPTNNLLTHIQTHAGMPPSILWDMLNSINGSSTIPSSVPKQQSPLLEDGLEISDSFCATNCMDISRLKNRLEHLLIQIGKNSQVLCMLSKKISQGLNLTKYDDDCILPDDNYPCWRTFKGEGASVKFKVPPVNGHDHLKGITICCAYIPSGDLDNEACESFIICLMIINYTKTTTLLYTEDKIKSLEEAEMKEVISNLEDDDQVEVKAVFRNGITLKKIAVYLIYNESFDEQMESSTIKAVHLKATKRKCEEDEEEPHQSIRTKKAMRI